jgi:uncharacterized protein (DUF433 family)
VVSVVRLLVGRESEVADAYRRGTSVTALAAEYNVSVSTICRVLDRAGVARRPQGRRVTRLRGGEAEVAALYLSGITIEEIARRFDCSTKPVNDALARAGVKRHRDGPRRRALAGCEDEIVRRYEAGETFDELATAFDAPRKTIARVLEDHGVAPRPPGRRRKLRPS